MMIEDKFYDCKHSEQDFEQLEDDNGNIDYETLRFCRMGCNPYLDCCLQCKWFEEREDDA